MSRAGHKTCSQSETRYMQIGLGSGNQYMKINISTVFLERQIRLITECDSGEIGSLVHLSPSLPLPYANILYRRTGPVISSSIIYSNVYMTVYRSISAQIHVNSANTRYMRRGNYT